MRIELFNTMVDLVDRNEATRLICNWIESEDGNFRFVVTPNVDHILQLQDNADFRAAYADASLVLIDGWPVASVAKWVARRKVEVVPGSDLVPLTFDALSRRKPGARIYLFGALPGVADLAAENISRKWPGLSVCGAYSPEFGFDSDARRSDEICGIIREARPDLIVVGLGAPKQELWIHRHRDRLGPAVAICAGATIDFLAGSKARAPVWVRKVKMEWAYRMFQEPRRLVRRYARGMLLFPIYVGRELIKHSGV